jgi:hypothetical protein
VIPTEHKAEPLPPCAFCGRPTAYIEAIGAVLHELPTCERYDALSPGDYLKACEKKLQEQTEESRRLAAELKAMLRKRGEG